MLEVIRHNQFKKDFKLAQKRGKKLKHLLEIIDTLANKKDLHQRFRPHKLSGDYKDLWECHIEPDYLMIYYFTETEIHLYRLGTHSDLF